MLVQGVPHQYGLHQYDFHQYEFQSYRYKISTSGISTQLLCSKIVLVEIGYVIPTSTNFAQYDFFQIPKIVLSEDPLYELLEMTNGEGGIKNEPKNFDVFYGLMQIIRYILCFPIACMFFHRDVKKKNISFQKKLKYVS